MKAVYYTKSMSEHYWLQLINLPVKSLEIYNNKLANFYRFDFQQYIGFYMMKLYSIVNTKDNEGPCKRNKEYVSGL